MWETLVEYTFASCSLPFIDLENMWNKYRLYGLWQQIWKWKWKHAKRVQQASHIMGGSSSSTSQKGFFPGCSFTSLFLSSALSSISFSTLCLSNSASTLQVGAAGLGGGGSDGDESGKITSETDVLVIFMSPSCFSTPSACLSVSPAHLVLVEGLVDEVWGSAPTVTMLLKSSDKSKITKIHSLKCNSRLSHRQRRTQLLTTLHFWPHPSNQY